MYSLKIKVHEKSITPLNCAIVYSTIILAESHYRAGGSGGLQLWKCVGRH
jgi:hypothetical protein